MQLSLFRPERAILEYATLICVGALCAVSPPIAHAQTPARLQHDLNLRDALERALRENPVLEIQERRVEQAQLASRRVWAETRLPDLNLGVWAGIVPGARGDIFSSPDQADDLDDWGPFYQMDLTLTQPLYTFGKISSAGTAARFGSEVTMSNRDEAHDQVVLEVVRAYWAAVTSDRSLDLSAELRDEYEELDTRVRAALEDPDSTVDDTHVLEVESFRHEVETAYQDGLTRVALSRKALILLLGLGVNDDVHTSVVGSPEFSLSLTDLDRLVDRALLTNPRMRALRAGVGALAARVDLARSSSLPDLFLSGGVRYGVAGNRTDQTNPFAIDNFNYRTIGAFVGMRWDLNFAGNALETAERRAERDAATAGIQVLARQLTLEVHEGFANAEKGFLLLQSATASRDAARSWLRLSVDNWDLGLGEFDRLLDAYRTFYRLQGTTVQQEFDYNMALARLALLLGNVDRYLDWVDAGVTDDAG